MISIAAGQITPSDDRQSSKSTPVNGSPVVSTNPMPNVPPLACATATA